MGMHLDDTEDVHDTSNMRPDSHEKLLPCAWAKLHPGSLLWDVTWLSSSATLSQLLKLAEPADKNPAMCCII